MVLLMGQSRAKRKIPINPRMRGETGNKGSFVLPQMFPGNLRRAIFEPSLGNSIYTEQHYNGEKIETCNI